MLEGRKQIFFRHISYDVLWVLRTVVYERSADRMSPSKSEEKGGVVSASTLSHQQEPVCSPTQRINIFRSKEGSSYFSTIMAF